MQLYTIIATPLIYYAVLLDTSQRKDLLDMLRLALLIVPVTFF